MKRAIPEFLIGVLFYMNISAYGAEPIQELAWEKSGHYSGSVSALLITLDRKVYAGGSGGVFRLEDDGKSWTSVGNELEGWSGIYSVPMMVVNPGQKSGSD